MGKEFSCGLGEVLMYSKKKNVYVKKIVLSRYSLFSSKCIIIIFRNYTLNQVLVLVLIIQELNSMLIVF